MWTRATTSRYIVRYVTKEWWETIFRGWRCSRSMKVFQMTVLVVCYLDGSLVSYFPPDVGESTVCKMGRGRLGQRWLWGGEWNGAMQWCRSKSQRKPDPRSTEYVLLVEPSVTSAASGDLGVGVRDEFDRPNLSTFIYFPSSTPPVHSQPIITSRLPDRLLCCTHGGQITSGISKKPSAFSAREMYIILYAQPHLCSWSRWRFVGGSTHPCVCRVLSISLVKPDREKANSSQIRKKRSADNSSEEQTSNNPCIDAMGVKTYWSISQIPLAM